MASVRYRDNVLLTDAALSLAQVQVTLDNDVHLLRELERRKITETNNNPTQ